MKYLKYIGLLTSFGLALISCAQQRTSSDPFISGDSFRAIADHLFDETAKRIIPSSIKKKDIVFIKTDYLEEFFTTIHPFIQAEYIIITHNSDLPAPGAFSNYLEDPKIIAWFGMNPSSVHPKFFPIPIGIANRCWNHGKIETFQRAMDLNNNQRNTLVGINFSVGTNISERKRVFDMFHTKDFCKEIFHNNHLQYLMNMAQTFFILSPEGNGLDCHRTWEALLMGAIPIVKSSLLNPLFEGLPVLIVEEWGTISEQFLHEKLHGFNRCSFNVEKKFFNYWKQYILTFKD